MALTTLQTVGLTGLGLATAAVGYGVVKQARERARLREQRVLPPTTPPPSCPEGLTPHLVEGQWQCLPVSAFEECLKGVYAHARSPLPESVNGLLGENARKTAAQFFGFHLSPEAMEEAYTVFAAGMPGHAEPEELYYQVLADLMPCNWPLWDPDSDPAAGFTPAPHTALSGWPLDWNYYLEPPAGITDRMEKAARSLSDLFAVAISQQLDQYLPVDVDPVMVISDAARDACARDDVLNIRAPGVPTSEGVIMGALTIAGYDPQTQDVDQVMAQLEAENPLLIGYLDGDWRISSEMQDEMWRVMLEVASFPRPVHNTVYNTQKGGSCPWEEKNRYTISMATFWYSAKRMAAIAELVGAGLPVIVQEGQGA